MRAAGRAWRPVKLRWWCPAMRCGSPGARRGDKREECWVWTAVVREADGSRRVDFEVGDHSECPFLWLYERLPEAGVYRSDAYHVYLGWFPPRAARGGQRRGGELERRAAFGVAALSPPKGEPADAANQVVHQEGGDAGLFPGPGLLATVAKIQCPHILRIPMAPESLIFQIFMVR